MKTLFIAVLLMTISISSVAQVSTQLTDISESDVNNAGLGWSFLGVILDDGNLYFLGSLDGFISNVWRTDGTLDGTIKIIEEDDFFWSDIRLTSAGVIINSAGNCNILNNETGELRIIPGIPDWNIGEVIETNSGDLYIEMSANDTVYLSRTNNDFSEGELLGAFGESAPFDKFTANDYGALLTSENSFDEIEPMFYSKELNSFMLLKDFVLSKYQIDAQRIQTAYLISNYLFLDYIDEMNSFNRLCIDMNTAQSNEINYFDDYRWHEEQEDFIIYAFGSRVFRLNKSDLTSEELYSGLYFNSPYTIINDKMYVIGGEKEKVIEIDLIDNSARELPNSETELGFYSASIQGHNGELYYISRYQGHRFLTRYDFLNNEPVYVDTMSEANAASVTHELFSVKGNLVFSKRKGRIHEAYVLGSGSSSTVEPRLIHLQVYPTVTEDILHLNIQDDISTQFELSIFDLHGKQVLRKKTQQDYIDVSSLPSGMYMGYIKSDFKTYNFQFVKK